jgi:hypothetical protein
MVHIPPRSLVDSRHRHSVLTEGVNRLKRMMSRAMDDDSSVRAAARRYRFRIFPTYDMIRLLQTDHESITLNG